MFEFTEKAAIELDSNDDLSKFRNQFHIPQHQGKDTLYFTGNSLGLQAKKTAQIINEELEDWSKFGVEGHFEARRPWFAYHEFFTEKLSKIVGAKSTEVVCMNGLTTNLHLLLATFYKPEGKKRKILMEAKAFPSDQYAIESHLNFYGFSDDENIIEVQSMPKSDIIDENDILRAIEAHADEIALVLIGGVNYYSGQVFDMEKITKKAHEHGVLIGFDLAHGAGNIALKLHNWQVDFAAWCSYKYLNAGPGAVSGIFIHENHAKNTKLKRFAGWWGHNKETRFLMEKGFDPIPTAEGWQLSNAPVFAMAPLLASLELFDEAGMEALLSKSKKLTTYLQFVIEEVAKISGEKLEIITPQSEKQRGCQLSVVCHGKGKKLFNTLTSHGVIADWREPNVIRLAPVPLYNSFMDIYLFGKVLQKALTN